jgi:hypothetical protein
VEVEHSVTISRPLGEVFALVGDPDRDLEWGTLMVESAMLSSGPLGVGSVFQQRAVFIGIRPSFRLQVTEYEPCKLMAYRVDRPVVADHRRVFEETAEGTRLTFYIRLDPPRQYQLGAAIMRRGVQRQTESDLNHIKEMLETAPPGAAAP